VRNAEGVEVARPGVEVVAPFDLEGEVIEARAERAERVAGRVGVAVEADEEAAVRMQEQDARYPDVELLDELEPENLPLPVGARVPVSYCQPRWSARRKLGLADSSLASIPAPLLSSTL
jgi:hypothetical protein